MSLNSTAYSYVVLDIKEDLLIIILLFVLVNKTLGKDPDTSDTDILDGL